MPEHLVLDAAAFVDLVLGAESSGLLRVALAGRVVHVPAHFDLEVLSALGRLHRSGELTPAEVEQGLTDLVQAPYEPTCSPGCSGERGEAGTRSAWPTLCTSSWPGSSGN